MKFQEKHDSQRCELPKFCSFLNEEKFKYDLIDSQRIPSNTGINAKSIRNSHETSQYEISDVEAAKNHKLLEVESSEIQTCKRFS